MLKKITDELVKDLDGLTFGPPVTHVYNPLVYARAPWDQYCKLYGKGPREILLIGMNPGPFGMAQVGVPFGEIAAVRDWLVSLAAHVRATVRLGRTRRRLHRVRRSPGRAQRAARLRGRQHRRRAGCTCIVADVQPQPDAPLVLVAATPWPATQQLCGFDVPGSGRRTQGHSLDGEAHHEHGSPDVRAAASGDGRCDRRPR